MEKRNRPDLENEMDELQRVVQDLSRDEDINVSVNDLVKSFKTPIYFKLLQISLSLPLSRLFYF